MGARTELRFVTHANGSRGKKERTLPRGNGSGREINC